jgi:hypothetical protein
MSLISANCYKRKCKWYEGVKQPEESELNEFHYCNAYPDGIPIAILSGDDLHSIVKPDQVGEYVYELSSV